MRIATLTVIPLLAGIAPCHADELTDSLAEIRGQTGVPAIGALVFREGKETAIAVDGQRSADSRKRVSEDDLWHLGSDTKAMTATLVARYVEAGELAFDTTVAELFPKFTQPAGSITLEQLLSHTAGLPANPPGPMSSGLRDSGKKVTEHRRELAEWALTNDLLSSPGETFLYSNVGYMVVGAVLEEKFGKPWEKLMADELFKPLKISEFGFGAPERNNPRGHVRDGDEVTPVGTGFDGDNPEAYGPAGTVHMSLRDWMKFGADHVAGARGEAGTLLQPETYAILHRPRRDGYALGWGVGISPARLSHDGSNTYWRARITLFPDADFGYLIVTNEAGDAGKQALDLVEEHLRER
jgi:D-alanyl-D-alanine carboxypeptidase